MGFLMGFLYKTPLYKKLIATSFIYILGIAIEDCTAASISLLFKASVFTVISETNFMIIGISFSTLLNLILVTFINRSLFQHSNSDDAELPASYWLAIFLVPTGSTYILHALNTQISGNQASFLTLSIIIILFAINFLVFYLYNKLMKEESLRYENILLAQQNDAYQNQVKLIQEFQTSIREQRHDMNNHFCAIKGLAMQQKEEDLMEYIDSLIDATQMPKAGINCKDAVIDAMINSKLYLAAQQHTKMEVSVNLPSTLPINQMDLTIILGNLLDNALEACIKLPAKERFVHIAINSKHDVLTIDVTNTYNTQDIDIRDGKVYSTKKDKIWHGIGLNNVKRAVEKYNGILEYNTYEKNENDFFSAKIMLYLSSGS
ncbi:MAG: GHKL domain-containing protein [Lacrimispora sp.]|uniref:GHKL domain-containing protein n=1 Tax=Lacrimispora sp. TaxID=2719234 RepID=UPI0039E38DC8